MDRRVKRRKRPVGLRTAAMCAADRNATVVPLAISPLAILERLPLADAVLTLLSRAFDPVFLSELFQKHRGRSFEQQISFANIVQLIGDALLQHGGSGRQCFARAQQDNSLRAS